MFKKLGEYVATFSVIILVFGLAKQILYYIRFSVPINYFISPSELGLIISDDLLLISTVFIGFTLIVYLTGNRKQMSFNEEKVYQEKLETLYQNLPSEKKKAVKKIHISLIITHVIGFMCAISLFALSKSYLNKLWAIIILFALLASSILEFKKKDIHQQLSRNSFYALSLLTLFIIALIFKTGFEIIRVENGKYKGTKIITNDSTYISSDTTYFIGKTDKYAFLYNKNDSTSTVIPTESIKKIVFKIR